MAQQAPRPCGTDLERQRLIETYPDYLQMEAEAEAEMRELLRNSGNERDENTLYTIPIVFHIIHLNGRENISNEQILDAVEVLNRDFQLMNPDSANVHPAFADRIGNPRMQFVLPTIDPYGNCTNGIERIKSPQTFLGESSSKFTPWPRNKYLNVWVTDKIASGAAGYFSGAPSFADGVLILHDYVGRIGTGAEFTSRALTHEVGHFFDLNHVWGENNGVPGDNAGIHMQNTCGDDGVEDTPITKGWNVCPNDESTWAVCDRQSMRNSIFNFDDVTTSSGTVDPSVVIPALDSIDFHVRANFSSFSATGVSANSEVAGKFAFSNWSTGANDGETDFAVLNANPINASKYYEITVTPVVTDYISVTSIDFNIDRNTTGVRTFAVRSANNNFTTNLPLNVNGDPNISVPSGNVGFFTNDATGQSGTITVTVPGHTNSATPLTFRIYAWNAEDANGTFILDEVVVKGVIAAVENVENYMEYSYCASAHMFTDGQVARLRAFAETTTNQRNSLWSDATLQSTGVADGYQWNCAPKADFYAVLGPNFNGTTDIPFSPTACAGDVVRFIDNSTGVFPEVWAWTFEDGTPSTSTERNPNVVFSSPGWKTVSMGVSNANGGDTKVDQYAVLIGGNGFAEQSNYNEDFENVAEDLNPYIAMNYAGNFTQFRKYTDGGHNSNSCAFLNSGDRYPINFIDPTNLGDYDELLTPSFDLHYFQSAQMSFWYSYSTTTTNIDTVSERLELWSSTNCGATWQIRTNINEEELITNGNLMEGPGTWEQKTITLPPSLLNPDIRFRFRYISSEFSGDLYIDDINISGPVGIEALDAQRLLNVFPNPSNDRFTVQAFGMDNYNTQVTVTDMRGAVIYNKTLAPTGDNGIEISSIELGMANGLYILRVSNELGTSTQKLTVGK